MSLSACDGSVQPPRLEIGVVVKPHGLRGWVKVHLHNPASEALAPGQEVVVVRASARQPVRITAIRPGGELVQVKLEGVEDRDQAEALRGARLEVGREALTPLEDGQYFYADLEGCEVVDPSGRRLGVVRGVFEAGASDVLVVRDGADERLIPLVEEWVASVDVAGRKIEVTDAEQWEVTRA